MRDINWNEMITTVVGQQRDHINQNEIMKLWIRSFFLNYLCKYISFLMNAKYLNGMKKKNKSVEEWINE